MVTWVSQNNYVCGTTKNSGSEFYKSTFLDIGGSKLGEPAVP